MPLIESTPLTLILAGLFAYGLGSIPFGMILARIWGLGNLRDIGSGNIGATNVLRTGNKKAAALTLILDAGKGAAAVLVLRAFCNGDAVQLGALAALIGHCYPVWLKFKGGKGVATYLGLMLALAWPVGLACCATWLVFAVLMRYSSLSALMAAGFTPLWMMFLGVNGMFILTLITTVLIYWRHRANIARLRAGTEPKIGQK